MECIICIICVVRFYGTLVWMNCIWIGKWTVKLNIYIVRLWWWQMFVQLIQCYTPNHVLLLPFRGKHCRIKVMCKPNIIVIIFISWRKAVSSSLFNQHALSRASLLLLTNFRRLVDNSYLTHLIKYLGFSITFKCCLYIFSLCCHV